eukprot:TRINITY_DN4297_c0_g3_i1.p1 TRINITY_DN4297_c0_g3~~TRINITY_DN4297_c0_g3_i1.p1  ORF type:complete len:705 (+),score=121.89 TRINITY_DN4297_c0_g3_i1:219-2333(+)
MIFKNQQIAGLFFALSILANFAYCGQEYLQQDIYFDNQRQQVTQHSLQIQPDDYTVDLYGVHEQQVGIMNRTSISGAQCVLPFVYRGEVWEDCFIVEGKSMCVVENVGLQECAPLEQQQQQQQQQQQIRIDQKYSSESKVRMTMTGEACEFPFEFGGQLYEDCVDVVGNEMCVVRGLLQECKPLPDPVSRTTKDGRECTFPFTLLGSQFFDCTVINGVEACMTDGGLSECIPLSKDDDSNVNATQPSSSQPSTTGRVTVDGRECIFPYSFMGTEYFDCTEFMGAEWCLLDAQWAKCMHTEVGRSTPNHKFADDSLTEILPQIQSSSRGFASLMQALGSMSELATLFQSFHLTNLVSLISNEQLEVTFFTPTNEAFQTFLSSQGLRIDDLIEHPDSLYQLLLYHIIPQPVTSQQLGHGQVLKTLLEEYPLTVDNEDRNKIIGILSQANIVTSDVRAGSAIIHTIDNVLLPHQIYFEEDDGKDKDTIEEDNRQAQENFVAQKFTDGQKDTLMEEMNTFMELSGFADLSEVVQGDLNGMTLFVPSNQAFEELFDLLQMSKQELIQDAIGLKDILLYHVIPQHISEDALPDKLVLPTFLDDKMLVVAHNFDKGVTTLRGIGSTAKVSLPAINSREGTIFIIDTVLLPFSSPALSDDLNDVILAKAPFNEKEEEPPEDVDIYDDEEEEEDEDYLGILDRMFSSFNTLFR